MFSSLSLSLVLVVAPLLASSVSALVTPHAAAHNVRDIRDTSLVARRRHHHHHRHHIARRSARRKRCLERSTFPSSSSPSSSPSSSSYSYSPAVVTTTTSNDPVLDLPINLAPAPPTTTYQSTYSAPYSAPYSPPTPQPPTPQPPTTNNPSPSSAGSGSGETHHGEGTYFDVGLGSCGKTSVNTDYMVAIGWELYDSFAVVANPNLNPVCGRQIRASYEGKSVDVVVLDRCGGCKPDDLDFSPSAFTQLADKGIGRLKNVEWHFI